MCEFFEITEAHGDKIAQCSKCHKKYKNPQETSTLSRHARTHGFLTGSQTQATFSTSGDRVKTTFTKRDQETSQLLRWIVDTTASFNTVTYKEFVALLGCLQPNYKVPSNVTISRKIQESKNQKRRGTRLLSEVY